LLGIQLYCHSFTFYIEEKSDRTCPGESPDGYR
jgi:hypothetical protein